MQIKLVIPVHVTNSAVYRVYVNNELHTERELDAGMYHETAWVFVDTMPVTAELVVLSGSAKIIDHSILVDDCTARTTQHNTQVIIHEG